MSTPASGPTTTDHLTRQQLDELDALLQRMLELPVHPLDDTPVDAESAVPSALGVLDEEPVASEPSPLPPSISLADSPFLLRNQPPAAAPEPPRSPVAPAEPMVDDAAMATAFWLWPLVWSNQLFDHCANRLGLVGRWLRRPSGRGLLGWAGLLLLTAAAVLFIIDWIRWHW